MTNKPWSIQIELHEGCFRNCKWCGVTYSNQPHNAMTLETAKKISDQLKSWLKKPIRIELAMGGEPLMNENYLEIIKIFSEIPKAQLQITTNGILLLDNFTQKVEALYRAGIDIIVLDMYEPEASRLSGEVLKLQNIKIVDFYNSKDSPYHLMRKGEKKMFLMGDISKKTGVRTNRKLLNHAGNIPPQICQELGIEIIKNPLEKKCTNVFRELTIKANGNVQICCMDFKKKFTLGNLHQATLQEIWNCEKYQAARALLFRKQRSFTPCNECNYGGGFRQGIGLKDPLPELDNGELLKKCL